MNSYREIENLIYRYAENIDLGDFEAVAEMFSEGAITGSPGGWCRSGYHDVLDMYRQLVKVYDDTGTPCTKHIVSNVIIDLGEDGVSATARSYFTVLQSIQDFPLQVIISGRYYDNFTRAKSQWSFRERSILPEFYGDLSRHLLFEVEALTDLGGGVAQSPTSLPMGPGFS